VRMRIPVASRRDAGLIGVINSPWYSLKCLRR
jgi:hypothetical protein